MNKSIMLTTDSIVCICMAIGFIYGITKFFRVGKALYLQMIVCVLGCMMLGRLFEIVMLMTNGAIPSGFHVGRFGVLGAFLFFFTANYGQMDSLVDDGSKQFWKYRNIALVAPAIIIAGFIPLLIGADDWIIRTFYLLLSIVMMLATYFNFKHLIIPDVDMGIIKSIRGYNLLSLILSVFCMMDMLFVQNENRIMRAIVSLLICIVSLTLIPILACK